MLKQRQYAELGCSQYRLYHFHTSSYLLSGVLWECQQQDYPSKGPDGGSPSAWMSYLHATPELRTRFGDPPTSLCTANGRTHLQGGTKSLACWTKVIMSRAMQNALFLRWSAYGRGMMVVANIPTIYDRGQRLRDLKSLNKVGRML